MPIGKKVSSATFYLEHAAPVPSGCGALPRSLPVNGIETETLGLHRAQGPNSRRVLLLG